MSCWINKLPHSLLIFSQSDSLIHIVEWNSQSEWQTVQIQISWLLQKPTYLALHCLRRQCISGFSRTMVKSLRSRNINVRVRANVDYFSKLCLQNVKQCSPWSVCLLRRVCSGRILFAQECLWYLEDFFFFFDNMTGCRWSYVVLECIGIATLRSFKETHEYTHRKVFLCKKKNNNIHKLLWIVTSVVFWAITINVLKFWKLHLILFGLMFAFFVLLFLKTT